ncbi:putative CocE/NonD family hydrolase [Arthrobacter sp. JUb119]|nr:putative CocE/NonD family hydrolase [Arthrobacter sp. JUb119]
MSIRTGDMTPIPEVAVEIQEYMVALSDGVHLATDVYRNSQHEGPLPVILERTPYGKRARRDSDQSVRHNPVPMPEEIAEFFISRGYVVVRQDCRGRGRSGGEFVKYFNEGRDGFDTIAWIRNQPWCDGRVLMNGVSYSAHAQTAVAALSPESLAGMFMDSGGFSSAYEVGMRMGGAFELKQATWAFRHAARSPEAASSPEIAAGLAKVDLAEWFEQTPWSPGKSPLSLAPSYESYLLDQWSRESFGEYWSHPAIYARGYYDRFPDVPSFHISSWYDPYISSAIENFQQLSSLKSSPAYLLLGPWTHGKRCQNYAGDVDFGTGGYFDGNLAPSYLHFRADWMDEVLGRARNATPRHKVTYFMMGGGPGTATDEGRLLHGGQWKHAATWPPETSARTTMYLHPGGDMRADPFSGQAHSTLIFDPRDPAPTVGGQVTSGEPLMRGGAYDQVAPAGARDSVRVSLADRADVLVFRSAVLDTAVSIAGAVTAEIYLSSSAPDTDLTIKLIDEYPPSADFPNGFAMNLTEGIMRVRYRDSYKDPELMQQGQVYRVTVAAPSTANLFAAGHRIRLDVSSSNFPRFDINPNTGGSAARDNQKLIAENTVHFSTEHPTSLSLHILPNA